MRRRIDAHQVATGAYADNFQQARFNRAAHSLLAAVVEFSDLADSQ